MMDILLVADGRSPITRCYINNLQASGYSVGLVSSFPCDPVVDEMKVIPVAFGQLAASLRPGVLSSHAPAVPQPSALRRLVRRYRGLFQAGRYVLGPLSVHYYAGSMRGVVQAWQPRLVHALRIPFEGMLASFIPPGVPLVVSIWGNDLTLHALGSAWMRALTVRCLQRAAGLAADASRDLRLGRLWGFDPARPNLVAPGSGGIDLPEINSIEASPEILEQLNLAPDAPLVINPRGFRPGSVRNDTFFTAIPHVLAQRPGTIFLCPAMAGQAEAQNWVDVLGVGASVRLLPLLPQRQLWALFKHARVFVSPSAHDGTPNSLLEAMACGCFPIAGDIESLREWITPGANGLLVEPGNSDGLAEAILLALGSLTLRQQAAKINAGIVAQRADAGLVRSQIKDFYCACGLS